MRVNAHIHTMAYIDQTQTKKEIEDAIRGNSVSNLAPTRVPDDVQLVLNVNPKDYRVANFHATANRSVTGATTVATFSAVKRTFITSATFSVCADALNDGAAALFTIQREDGSTFRIFEIRKLTLTALQQTNTITFKEPIEALLGGNSSITFTFAAGSGAMACTLNGFTVEK